MQTRTIHQLYAAPKLGSSRQSLHSRRSSEERKRENSRDRTQNYTEQLSQANNSSYRSQNANNSRNEPFSNKPLSALLSSIVPNPRLAQQNRMNSSKPRKNIYQELIVRKYAENTIGNSSQDQSLNDSPRQNLLTPLPQQGLTNLTRPGISGGGTVGQGYAQRSLFDSSSLQRRDPYVQNESQLRYNNEQNSNLPNVAPFNYKTANSERNPENGGKPVYQPSEFTYDRPLKANANYTIADSGINSQFNQQLAPPPVSAVSTMVYPDQRLTDRRSPDQRSPFLDDYCRIRARILELTARALDAAYVRYGNHVGSQLKPGDSRSIQPPTLSLTKVAVFEAALMDMADFEPK